MGRYGADRGRDRRIVAVGAVLTVVLTAFFLVLPFLAPIGAFKRAYFDLTGNWVSGDPLSGFRFVGGPIAGFLTGYFTDGRWNDSVRNASKAVVLGVVSLYLLVVVYYLARSALVWGSYPLLQIFVLPVFVGFPIAVIAVFGGYVGGLLGHVARFVVRQHTAR